MSKLYVHNILMITERHNELGICAGQLSALQLLLQEPVKDQIASKMDEESGCAHAKIRGLFGEDEEIIFFEVWYTSPIL